MKPSKINYALVCVLLVAFCTTVALAGEQENIAGYLGVRLMPVPELLRVHLGLDEGAGQLIINIVIDSPADKAGLGCYDVITALNEQEVRDYDKFVEAIQSAGAGAKVTLALISGGKKRNVTVHLKEAPTGPPDWKYKKTPLDINRYDQPRQYEKRFFWGEPFEDDEFEFSLPDKLKRFFRKEFRPWKDPNDRDIIIIPGEQNDRIDKIERRLEEIENRQKQIMKMLKELKKE